MYAVTSSRCRCCSLGTNSTITKDPHMNNQIFSWRCLVTIQRVFSHNLIHIQRPSVYSSTRVHTSLFKPIRRDRRSNLNLASLIFMRWTLPIVGLEKGATWCGAARFLSAFSPIYPRVHCSLCPRTVKTHRFTIMAVNLSKNGPVLTAAYNEVVDEKSDTNWWVNACVSVPLDIFTFSMLACAS